ncbi:DNA transformation protein [Aureimonas altamirensis DSM 21988]|jgi:DNA transformation protein and related proteins|uniref:DNA transformation protein n=1 Tax=Aureimonas altamirensis DSM 21988 TaxID=1121026 RepID=A0ABY1I6J9_9HYPH|nr:TfoX/Sxy family protein [Aureimonas altamirensis]SHI69836.1 DNA transformation protein [Aureimonas altamirensis DSM 21988]
MERGDIEELFRSIADLRIRPLFGGKGIYDGEVIIALVAFDTLFLKSDTAAEADYVAAGSTPFVYEAAGRKPVRMPYYSCPPEAFDDPEIAAEWVATARAAAHRTVSSRRSRARRTAGSNR